MTERVLFEWKRTADGVQVTTAPDWPEFRPAARIRLAHGPGFLWPAWACPPEDTRPPAGRTKRREPPVRGAVQHALDSLQTIYDDLYGRDLAEADG
jgi:hypothetical protein